MTNHHIQPGTTIRYNRSNGGTAVDRVIRVEGEDCIISVPTIGGTWVERDIPVSMVISYTNHYTMGDSNC